MRFTFDHSPMQTVFALVAILALGAQIRLLGIGWDANSGLHPDERHLFFVTQEIFRAFTDPANAGLSVSEWWFSEKSPINPHWGDKSFVYGNLPLLSGALAGIASGATDWFAFMAVARTLSVWLDVSTILAVFLGARLVSGNAGGLFAAILYTMMPTALQLANFHTVDVWLSAGVTAATVPMLAIATGRTGRMGIHPPAVLAGFFLGLAVASKITGLLVAVPALLALGFAAYRCARKLDAVVAFTYCLFAALISFRLANPFAFQGPGFWGMAISAHWIEDFTQIFQISISPDFPPNWQWIAGYGFLPFLRDLLLFGVGPVAAGLLVALLASVGCMNRGSAIALAAFGLFFALAAFSSASALRYAAPGFAPLAMAVAPFAYKFPARAAIITLGLAIWWGTGAVFLHDGQHPRVVASHWLWTLPKGTVLTNETGWDDGLPVIVSLAPGEPLRWPGHDNWFTLQNLDITAPDSPEKADQIAKTLAATDFMILSSDRQSGVMPRLHARFPLTAAHYRFVFSGQACFSPVLIIDRGYPLPGFRLNDIWAQEPWRVYDHPVVQIFRRDPCFDPEHYAQILTAAMTKQ